MSQISLSNHPYFDDYDASKGFHQIAFIPGRPVQARELTQIQTILQEQIRRVGNHFFKNGSVIIPGHSYYDPKVYAIRLAQSTNDVSVDSYVNTFLNKTIKNANGTTAKVIWFQESTASDSAIIYVKFLNGGNTGSLEFFRGDTLEDIDDIAHVVAVTDTGIATSGAAIATVEEGVYYANGYFVQVLRQTIVLSNTDNLPTCSVDLSVVESVVTEADDDSLYDNAIGSSNITAPGAHRKKISLDLTKTSFDEDNTDANSNLTVIDTIKLFTIQNGEIQYMKGDDTEYARFEGLMAKRTYEESGDYVVDDFEISAIDYRDNFRGDWTTNKVYLEGDIVEVSGRKYFAANTGVSGGSSPIHTAGTASDGSVDWTAVSNATPYMNAGLLKSEYDFDIADPLSLEKKADDSFALRVANGIAYVNGYRTEIKGTSLKIIDKARSTVEKFNSQVNVPNSTVVYASAKINGTTQAFNVRGIPDIGALDKFDVYDLDGSTIGYCRVKSIEALTGSGFSDENFKVAIFDISMNKGKEFLYNAFRIKGQAGTDSSACEVYLSRRVIELVGTHSSSGSTLNGVQTNYDEELRVGNYVTTGRTTALYKVTAITSDVQITLAAPPSYAAGTQLFVSVVAFKAGSVSSISKLPHSFAKTLRSVDVNGDVNTTYRVIKQIDAISSGGGVVTFTLPPGENFQPTGHYLYQKNTITGIAIADEDVANDGSSITVSGVLNTTEYRLHARISKSGIAAAERKKIFKSTSVYIFSDGVYTGSDKTGKISADSVGYNASSLSLWKADVIRINKISAMGADAALWSDSNTVDYTSKFSFDNGQRAEFYDYATIKKTSASTTITGPIRVSFDYFEHTSGDYFTVDSYQDVPYATIPDVKVDGVEYSLRDCIDFRVRVNDTGSGTNDFMIVGDVPQTNEVFVFDASYYVGRIDSIMIDSSGEIQHTMGEAGFSPVTPKAASSGLVLATISMKPYTYNAENDVEIKRYTSKRYTMKDIQRLESRVENVEEYVKLSLLEKNTADFSIKDKYGLDRMKNGFYVADYSSNENHAALADIKSTRSDIDLSFNSCIPKIFATDYPLVVVSPSGSTTNASIYPGNVMTLTPSSYSNFDMKGVATRDSMPRFSTAINVNPFNVISYTGKFSITPSNDTWNTLESKTETVFKVGNNTYSTLTSAMSAFKPTNSRVDRISTDEISSEWDSDLQREIVTSRIVERITSITATGAGDIISSQTTGTDSIKADRFIRPRVVVTNTTKLMPNSWHSLKFDNRDVKFKSGSGASTPFSDYATFLPALKFVVSSTDIIEEYSKYSIYSSVGLGIDPFATTGAVSSTHPSVTRSFDFIPGGSSYDVAVNGRLVNLSVTAGATKTSYGVVLGSEKISDTQVALYVMPTTNFSMYSITGTVTASSVQLIDDKTKAVTKTYTGISFGSAHEITESKIKTSSIGNIFGIMIIPHAFYITGTKALEYTIVLDNTTNTSGKPLSSAEGSYTASGSITVTNLRVVRGLATSTTSTIRTRTVTNRDPISQSFTIKKSANGVNSDVVMVSGVKIWMSKKPSTDHSIEVAIVTAENGYPTTNVVTDWAETIVPAADITIATQGNAWTPHTFNFDAPVPLNTNTEYCIRVMAETSNEFEAWTSKMGEVCLNYPSEVVTAQQGDGSLFLSQNSSTWTADQYSDLAAQLIIANYPVNISSTMDLHGKVASGPGYTGFVNNSAFYPITSPVGYANGLDEYRTLPYHPFGCNGTTTIKVYHPSHPFQSNNQIVRLSLIPTATVGTTGDSITDAIGNLINGKYFKVTNVKPNSYSIDLNQVGTISSGNIVFGANGSFGSNLNGKVRFGGNWWTIIGAGEFDVVTLAASPIVFPNTSVDFTKKLTYRDDIGDYVEDSAYTKIIPNESVFLDKQYVAFIPNEYQYNITAGNTSGTTNLIGRSPSGINVRCHMATSNKFTTPIIDLTGFGLNIWKNMSKVSSISDNVVDTTDFVEVITTASGNCVFDGTEKSIQLPISSNLITSFEVGGVVNVSGVLSTKTITIATWATNSATITAASHGFLLGDSVTVSDVTPAGYNGTFTITFADTNTFQYTVANPGGAGTVFGSVVGPSIVNGNRAITAIDTSTRKLYVDGIVSTETIAANLSMGIQFIGESTSNGGTAQSKEVTREVVLQNAASSLHITAAMNTPSGTELELWYRTGNSDLSNTVWVKFAYDFVTSEDQITFYDNTIKIDNLEEFTRFQVKIVFASTNQRYPQFKELRIIALA